MEIYAVTLVSIAAVAAVPRLGMTQCWSSRMMHADYLDKLNF